MKITFITTVFNEERTIGKLLESLANQSQQPDETIIVDGGSTDDTCNVISRSVGMTADEALPAGRQESLKIKLFTKKGNRSVGRNEAIKHATGDIIACSDAGNILDKDWLKNITAPFRDKSVDVVAGYYKGSVQNVFQKSLIPYVLVMPDKINPDNFLPATRSMAFTKAIWKKAGGFDERFSHNEDYVFARKLKNINAKIVFKKDAIVYWIPRNNLQKAFYMFYRFAYGDAEANILRPKVLFLFTRYITAMSLFILFINFKSPLIFNSLFLIVIFYFSWAIFKNYKYVNNYKGILILPIIQLAADIAVLSGTISGILMNIFRQIKENKLMTTVISLYAIFVIFTLNYGTPNKAHPFPYHMDEWHQLSAMKAIIKHGTTTIPGSAEIPFLYPVLSGLYLIPFILFNIINPFFLKSPLDNLLMQQKLFEILRSVNIWFGIGSILLIAKIAKSYFRINRIIPAYFFALSPILIMLSGYFKYDIALLFFIILSLTFIFKFGQTPTLKNFIYASFSCGLAMSVKFSAIPLLPLLLFSCFLYKRGKKINYHFIFLGMLTYFTTFLIAGIPSIFIGKAFYSDLLYSNIVGTPQETYNLILSSPWWVYLTVKIFPDLFGHLFYVLALSSFFYLIFFLLYKSQWMLTRNKNIIFLMMSFISFLISLIPLKIWASGNRALVLLPFLSLIMGIVINHIYNISRGSYKYFLIAILLIVAVLQLAEYSMWVYTKLRTDPQKESSEWIKKNIEKGSYIGIENIPIYQFLPNVIVNEFYTLQYNINKKTTYKYEVIDAKSKKLPPIIIISFDELSKRLYKENPKNLLMDRLTKEGYKKIAVFSPDFKFIKLIGNDIDYYFTGLITSPSTISVYKKYD